MHWVNRYGSGTVAPAVVEQIEVARDEAISARDAAIQAGNVFPDTAAGIAAVADGGYFSVPSATDSESLILYRRSGAAAVEVKRYPSADAIIKPKWTGRRSGWPDPFFRHFDLSSETFLGRDRWWRSNSSMALNGWSRVASAVFDGYALRRAADIGTTILNGPTFWLDEMGVADGDMATFYALIVGDGAVVTCAGRFTTGSDSTYTSTQVTMRPLSGASTITASATPQWVRYSAVVPAGSKRFAVFPYTATAGKTFDVVAIWGFKGSVSDGPEWPVGFETDYIQARDAITHEVILPPNVYLTQGREGSIYFDNLIPDAAADYLWDVSGVSAGAHQAERWTHVPTGAIAAATMAVEFSKRDTGNLLASATTQVSASAASAGSGLTPKVLFVGDSLTAAGTYTGELVTIAGGDVMDIELLGTQGSGANKHEGRSGWTVGTFVGATSPFYISGAVNFPQYLINNGLSTPDWVCIMLGINDVFNATSDAMAAATADAAFANLDTLITSIKSAGESVKVALMTAVPPASSQDGFGASYGTGQTRWRFKRNLAIWNRDLIARYRSRTGERLHIVPTHVALDTVNNVSKAAAAPINSRTSETIERQNNGVHPASAGYYQIADAVWAFLKCNA